MRVGAIAMMAGSALAQIEFMGEFDDHIGHHLYCLGQMRGLPNPQELPNDRCCPIYRVTGIPGVAYSSTTKGCCGTETYDLELEHCCFPANVIMKGVDPENPHRITKSKVSFDPADPKKANVNIEWEVVLSADNYEVSVGPAYNSTWRDASGSGYVLGQGETMGLSATVLQKMLVGKTYDVKIRAIDCLDRHSAWLTTPVVVRP